MLLVIEIAAGVVLGGLVLAFLAALVVQQERQKAWRIADAAEKARRHSDTLAHYIKAVNYWEHCRHETPQGFDDGSGWVSPEEIAQNVEFHREGLAHIEAGTYEAWAADHAAATRERMFGGLQPDPTGRQRFKAS